MRRSRRPWTVCLVLVSLLAASRLPVRADDSSAGLPLPALQVVAGRGVLAESARVSLGQERVTLSLALRQSGQGAVLVCQTPRFAWLGEAEPYPDRHFPELSATLDGRPLNLQSDDAAFVGNRNVTEDVRAAGLDIFLIASDVPVVQSPTAGAARAAFDRLLKARALEPAEGQVLAHWKAQRTLRFALGDAPHSLLSISYRARPAFELVPSNRLGNALQWADYCLRSDQDLTKLFPHHRLPAQLTVQRYRIATSVGRTRAERVEVQVVDSGTVFCGADGKPRMGGSDAAAVPARTDHRGMLNILKIAAP